MSSDDGNDCHKNQHSQPSVMPNLPNASSSATITSSSNSNTIRRKSLTQGHYQHHHQLQPQAININCNSGTLVKEKDRERIEICERTCNDVGTITNQIGSCSMAGGRESSFCAPSASPIRFIQQDENGYPSMGSGRLSACSSDRYDEHITCCLPPPSPAPTSDRFVIGLPSPSNSHYQDHRFSVHQTRTMSPNSRFRTIASTDRYRDMSPKCDRFAAHYLANSTPLASTENYAYLSSIVHTPVKRYIPTPPPSTNDSYSDTGYHNNRSHPTNNIPYRLRLKCCDQAQSSLPPQQQATNIIAHDSNVSDHYATPPRGRPIKCNSNSNITAGIQSVGGSTGTQTITRSRCGADNSDYNNGMNRTPSVEYIGPTSGRVITPVSVLSEPNSISCLHCNTLRRATGVHQTTQTTGPISPVPISTGSNQDFIGNQTSTNPPPPKISPTSPIPSSSVSLPSLQQQQQPLPPPSPVQSIQMVRSQESSPRPQRKENSINFPASSSTRHNYELPPQSLPPPIINLQRQNNHQSTQHQIMIQSQTHSSQSQLQGQQQNRHPPLVRLSRKQKLKEYIRRQFTQFFGIDEQSEEYEKAEWMERQKRFATRQFGQLSTSVEINVSCSINQNGERPDILPAQINDDNLRTRISCNEIEIIPKKLSVPKMVWNGCSYVIQTLIKKRARRPSQWSRSFAPHHITAIDDGGDLCDGLSPLQEDEVFFDSPNTPNRQTAPNANSINGGSNSMLETRQMYMPERAHGWRTRSTELQLLSGQGHGYRGTRISSQLIDGVLDNSRRSIQHKIKLLRSNELDDRNDYRPVFTYWINTVQIMVLILSIICYGFGPIGIGMEQKSSQVLVTSLSLQQVHHMEQRNVWIGLRGGDLVHLGAKFATCMRRDARTLDVVTKTRRNERETACCIRNDDSGCVQSSQADCSVSIMPKNSIKNMLNDQKFIPKVRGLWPTVSKAFITTVFITMS